MKAKHFGFFLGLLAGSLIAADSPSFRGPARDGIFAEQGLLKSWPAEGPRELWFYEGLGEGYSSLAIVGDAIYTTGKVGDKGFVFAISREGTLLWKTEYGAETEGSGFPGARSTPEVDDKALYVTSGSGSVIALNRSNGAKLWEVNILSLFGGSNPHFSISESVLVDGNKLYCTPGGKDAAVVALDKATGKTLWQTKGFSDNASYCSARIFKNGKFRQIITLTETFLVGINPEDGKVAWKTEVPVTYGIHAISPLYSGNTLYIADGYDQGGRAFELAADGQSIKELWKEPTLDIHHGGAVLYKDHIYGSSSKGLWGCLDLKTGKVVSSFGPKYENLTLGKGSVIFADGLLYGYDEKGNMGLINPDPKSFKPISTFQIKRGEAQHWAHPVINNGRLYVRHGNVLMCFDIKQ